jgi:hypothetical protein
MYLQKVISRKTDAFMCTLNLFDYEPIFYGFTVSVGNFSCFPLLIARSDGLLFKSCSLYFSVSDPVSVRSVDPDSKKPDPDPGGQKLPTKVEKKYENFMF